MIAKGLQQLVSEHILKLFGLAGLHVVTVFCVRIVEALLSLPKIPPLLICKDLRTISHMVVKSNFISVTVPPRAQGLTENEMALVRTTAERLVGPSKSDHPSSTWHCYLPLDTF